MTVEPARHDGGRRTGRPPQAKARAQGRRSGAGPPARRDRAPKPVPTAVDQTTTATTAAPTPERKLSSDFDWPEDEVAAGGTKFLPSGLDVPPPTAN